MATADLMMLNSLARQNSASPKRGSLPCKLWVDVGATIATALASDATAGNCEVDGTNARLTQRGAKIVHDRIIEERTADYIKYESSNPDYADLAFSPPETEGQLDATFRVFNVGGPTTQLFGLGRSGEADQLNMGFFSGSWKLSFGAHTLTGPAADTNWHTHSIYYSPTLFSAATDGVLYGSTQSNPTGSVLQGFGFGIGGRIRDTGAFINPCRIEYGRLVFRDGTGSVVYDTKRDGWGSVTSGSPVITND